MKIAIVTPYDFPIGGVEQVNYTLKNFLEIEGHNVQIVSNSNIIKSPFFFRALCRIFGNYRLLALYFNQIVAKQVNCVICNGEFGYGINHPNAIISFHGCYYGYGMALKPFISSASFERYMHLANIQADAASKKFVIADSTELARVLAQQGIVVDAVIDNGIDTDHFSPRDAERNGRYLFVGAPDYYGKGYDILEKLTDRGLQIDCISSSPPIDRRLNWLGSIPNYQLPFHYASYEGLVFPSRFEGCGLVALEAMACGTPVIMTNVGIGPDLSSEIPEFVVSLDSESIIDDIINRATLIKAQHDRFAQAARGYVLKHHSLELCKERWLEVLQTVIARD